MPLFTKPQFNNVWASTGAKLAPEVAKINQGWIVEIPPHEFDNWMQNRQDALLAHLNQLGIPQWDSTVEYQAGKSYVQGTTTGVVYKALTTHSNVNPEIDIQNNWVIAFESSGTALLKANNLADVPDKAQARINLGIATTEFYDGRYLLRSSNLSDVPNKATARNNLGLGNSATRDVGTAANTVAAGNDLRIVNAVPIGRRVNAGSGLTGGGWLDNDVTVGLGTPSPITATSTNFVSGTTHSHSFDVSSFLPTTYVDVTGQRASTGTYYNTTGKMMMVAVTSGNTVNQATLTVYVNDVWIMSNSADMINGAVGVSFIVPINVSYRVDSSQGIQRWTETR